MAMKSKNMEIIGTKDFHGSVDITDPCYDRDILCRINDVKIKQGVYTCMVSYRNESYEYNGETHTATHTRLIGIYLNGAVPSSRDMEDIGDIGVDTGMAGFFHNKPDYDENAWTEFCKNAPPTLHVYLEDVGFFCGALDGDGVYPVYAHRDNSGEIDALEIRFR